MTAGPPPTDVLAPLLAEWLPRQRWYGGQEVPAQVLAVHEVGRLTEQPYRATVFVVDTPSGSYQVPLVVRPVDDQLAHAHVGTIQGAQHAVEVYDALHDKSVTQPWITRIAGEDRAPGLEFRAAGGDLELPVDQPSLVVSAEQSNTSLIFGDAAILKIFRRVEPGRNPDIEVHTALAARGGAHVARLLGHVRGRWGSGSTTDGPVEADLAMLQEFLRSATDGWQLALISVRDLLAEGDLHADEVGGDFAAESTRLGQATAVTHADLAAVLPTGTYGPDDLATLADAMDDRLERAVVDVPALAPYADGLRRAYGRLRDLDATVPTQRVHGDYHLGQVMRTTQRWVLLDFEGEPLKPFAERTGLDSPLRDVAGMLRSFDYAARHGTVDRPGAQAEYRADEWAERNRGAFLDGYAEEAGADPRTDPVGQVLLAAYEADKAVYEVTYEAAMRPTWLPVPLAAVQRLAAAAG